jgi:hypothetical protein
MATVVFRYKDVNLKKRIFAEVNYYNQCSDASKVASDMKRTVRPAQLKPQQGTTSL